MNYLIFNESADDLKALVYGLYGNTVPMPAAVDSNGDLLISPLSVISVTATALDIRPLSAATDSVLVSANNLDIRDLSGAQDSVELYSCRFIEDDLSTSVTSGTNYLMTKEIGPYRENSFFIRNNGGSSITVTLQAAATDSNNYYVDIAGPDSVSGGTNNLTSVTPVMKFARLMVEASTTVAVDVFYNARA